MSGLKKEQKPFRIWDENAKRDLPWRAYKTFERAVEKALTLLVWLPIGNAYTIYDARSHKAKIQWQRRPEGLRELRE